MGEQIFVGAALGLLTGLLVGLSASPVVSSVVSALAAAIVPLLGLVSKDGSRKVFAPGSTIRLGTFALTCALATLGGLYIRTHDLLSPSPQQEKAALIAAGFNEQEAKQWLLSRRFSADKSAGVGSSVLFSNLGIDDCQNFDPKRYKDSQQHLEYLKSLRRGYAAFAAGIQSLTDADKTLVLNSTQHLFCPE